jgi:hypothetical protein
VGADLFRVNRRGQNAGYRRKAGNLWNRYSDGRLGINEGRGQQGGGREGQQSIAVHGFSVEIGGAAILNSDALSHKFCDETTNHRTSNAGMNTESTF